jgi:hypothetical protein
VVEAKTARTRKNEAGRLAHFMSGFRAASSHWPFLSLIAAAPPVCVRKCVCVCVYILAVLYLLSLALVDNVHCPAYHTRWTPQRQIASVLSLRAHFCVSQKSLSSLCVMVDTARPKKQTNKRRKLRLAGVCLFSLLRLLFASPQLCFFFCY